MKVLRIVLVFQVWPRGGTQMVGLSAIEQSAVNEGSGMFIVTTDGKAVRYSCALWTLSGVRALSGTQLYLVSLRQMLRKQQL